MCVGHECDENDIRMAGYPFPGQPSPPSMGRCAVSSFYFASFRSGPLWPKTVCVIAIDTSATTARRTRHDMVCPPRRLGACLRSDMCGTMGDQMIKTSSIPQSTSTKTSGCACVLPCRTIQCYLKPHYEGARVLCVACYPCAQS